MDRPSHVMVLGQRFEIEYAHNDPAGRPALAGEMKSGAMVMAYQRITIDTDQADDQLRDTLLHEIVHACRQIIGIDIDDTDQEEATVRALTPVLLDTLRSSPAVTAFLFGET